MGVGNLCLVSPVGGLVEGSEEEVDVDCEGVHHPNLLSTLCSDQPAHALYTPLVTAGPWHWLGQMAVDAP